MTFDVKVVDGELQRMEITGDLSGIIVNTAVALHNVYSALNDSSTGFEAGKAYRDAIVETIKEIFDGPEALDKKLSEMISELEKANESNRVKRLRELVENAPDDWIDDLIQVAEEVREREASDGDKHIEGKAV